MAAFVRNCLVKNDFDAVLATFFCYDYDANAPEGFRRSLQKFAE